MKKIDIRIPAKEYPVFIGANIFDSLEKIIRIKKLSRNLFMIIDRKVMNLYRDDIKRFSSNFSGKIFINEFDASEANKSYLELAKIYNDLIAIGYGRDSLIVAIGGGITGDIAGFAASTFARGIQFVQVPTTLLAAVDSSVGGKTGINFGETKNIIGAFHQPEFVLIDTEFLKTLPEEEIICGIGEIVKYAFLSDKKFFELLKNNFHKLLELDSTFTTRAIETCIKFKGDVVAKDEKESGLRKILNLGHTFAHAIEVEQNYLIKHGQAVVVGLACALELSRRTGLLSEKLFTQYLQLPFMFKDKITLNAFDPLQIYEIMKRDKKGRENRIKFVLLKEIGRLIVDVEAEKDEVIYCLNKSLALFIK
ncbi:MAG: 3-dehydroquinate synthase [Bacteroidota bacterium]